MAEFDYAAPAELFLGGVGRSRRAPVGYRRFSEAAQAIQYAVEQLEQSLLKSACLQIDEARYNGAAIEQLYSSAEYPLTRRGLADESEAAKPAVEGARR
jgi:hypothetical protein